VLALADPARLRVVGAQPSPQRAGDLAAARGARADHEAHLRVLLAAGT
jgi:hypothetical protein